MISISTPPRLSLFLLISTLLLVNCNDENTDPVLTDETVTINIEQKTVTLLESKGETTVTIASSISWQVSENIEWLETVKVDEKSLQVSYDANSNPEQRQGIAKVIAGKIIEDFTIIQRGSVAITAVSSLTLPEEGGDDHELAVSVNRGNWTASTSADWITDIDYADQTKLIFDYEAYTGEEPRTATITITSTEDPTITHTITINQSAPEPAVAITAVSSLTLSAEGEENYELPVSVNRGNWTASTSADWITGIDYADQTKLIFDYQAYTGEEPRTATITITSTEDPTITHTITINQSAPGPITITAVSSLTLSAEGGEGHEFSVSVNRGNWTAATPADWITGIDYADQTKLVFDYKSYTGEDPRTATITITSTEDPTITHAITIQQEEPEEEAAPAVTITAPRYIEGELPSAGGEDHELAVSVSSGGWTAATTADWITGIDYSDQSKLVFDYKSYTGEELRTATITITSTEDPTITHAITINQSAPAPITISAVSSLTFPSEGGR